MERFSNLHWCTIDFVKKVIRFNKFFILAIGYLLKYVSTDEPLSLLCFESMAI